MHHRRLLLYNRLSIEASHDFFLQLFSGLVQTIEETLCYQELKYLVNKKTE